jgi:hypothetical protein
MDISGTYSTQELPPSIDFQKEGLDPYSYP